MVERAGKSGGRGICGRDALNDRIINKYMHAYINE